MWRKPRVASWMSAALLAATMSPVWATDNDDRRWDPQQYGIYNYSPCTFFESDFPSSSATGNPRSRVLEGRNKWNAVGRELYFRSATGCSKWLEVKWDDLLVPFNDDWGFVSNDQWGDISNSTVNFNRSPDKSGGGTYPWYWGTSSTTPSGHVDGISVAVHEFGHSVALGHTSQCTCDIMYNYINAGTNRRNLTTHDRQSIGALYAAAQ